MQHSHEPAAKWFAERYALALHRPLGAEPDNVRHGPELVALQRPAHQERQRDNAHLHHIAALVEPRTARPRGDGDPKITPQPIARQAQLVDRQPQHVVGDDDAGVWRDEEALGCESAMSNVSRVLMQDGHGGYELADDAERGVRVDVDRVLFRGRQHLGQASTRSVFRDDAEHGSAFETVDPTDTSVSAVTEVGKAIDPFAERELECGNCNEFGGQAQDAELVTPFFSEANADAETIGEIRRGWRGRRGVRGFHEGPRARGSYGCRLSPGRPLPPTGQPAYHEPSDPAQSKKSYRHERYRRSRLRRLGPTAQFR